jgi:hypothetical protein
LFRQSIFINRIDPIWSVEYSYFDNRSVSFLVSGFESRINQYHQAKLRITFNTLLQLENDFTTGFKERQSELFINQRFFIAYFSSEPKVVFQGGTQFRIALSYKYTEKNNQYFKQNEQAKTQNSGIELRYAIPGKGNLNGNFNYIVNTYISSGNPSLDFEMLEGLLPGENYTWSVNYQQNIGSNLQLNINYNARKSTGNPAIHTGGMQLRAFF